MSWDNLKELKQSKNYQDKLEEYYLRRLRSSKIIYNLSEFLKFLSIKEGDILKSMLVKFTCEAIGATRGSLLLRDAIHKEFFYYDTVLFKNERQVLEDFNSKIDKILIPETQGQYGETYSKKQVIIYNDISKTKYDTKVDKILNIDPISAICVPIIVDKEFIGILELVNSDGKRNFDKMDLESVNTIANIATATMENAKLFKWAISDGLTGLFNIHFFKRMVEQEIKKINRYGGTLSLIMLDIDKFKNFNDTYGHSTGDKVLQKLSDILIKNIREEIDLPGRYGGDEFLLLLPNTDIKGAKILADRLLNKIRKAKIKVDKQKLGFTSSIGCAEYQKGKDIKELFKAVDKAMYESKKKGRNKVSVLETY